MRRRVFSRRFKLGAVTLVPQRGVAVLQVARDLDVAESVLTSNAASPPTILDPGNATGSSLAWVSFQSAPGSVLQRR